MKRQRREILSALFMAALPLIADAAVGRPAERVPAVLPVRGDRILVLAPHPDDETLACGGIIQKAVALRVPVHIVFMTYGDDNEWSFFVYRKHPVLEAAAAEKMGRIRDEEARRAAAKLGLRPDQLTFLGYPDHGLESIWLDHWSGEPPAVGGLSRARQVPYPDAYRPGAPYKGEEIISDLEAVLREFHPTKVFLSHPADHHPDHRSLYAFACVALWDIEERLEAPQLFPYLVHFGSWPDPRGLHPTLEASPPSALRSGIAWSSEVLKEREVSVKLEALKQHKTQYESSAPFLGAFIRRTELFGDFPEIVAGRGNADPEERRVQVQVRDGRLVIAADGRPGEAKKARFSFRAFGYRRDVPFGHMPKLRVSIADGSPKVFKDANKLDPKTVEVEREGSKLVVSLPLEALGDPQKVFLGSWTPPGADPTGYFSWKVLVLPSAGPGAGRGR
ncbi:MAG TPA: PIG-L family deacetylase [Acidobacteriota bacterium]|nr:PIG-L family deacetylase [Acidobacteriota bacterium]